MEEMGCEFVEVTAHPGARPSHAVWQGKVFRISGAVTVKLRRARTRLNDFLKETGLRRDNFREQAADFGRSAAGKASWAARLQQRLDDVNQELQSLREDGKIKLTGKFVTAPKLQKQLEFNEYTLERMAERGITPEDAQNIVKNALFAIEQRNGTQHAYYSDKGFIAVKADGTTSSVGWHDEGAKIVLEVAKKYGFYHK